jgi:hypothetical protein
MHMQTRVPLSTLPTACAQSGYGRTTYRRCYNAAVDARIPVTRSSAGRWEFDPAELEEIAAALGLVGADV